MEATLVGRNSDGKNRGMVENSSKTWRHSRVHGKTDSGFLPLLKGTSPLSLISEFPGIDTEDTERKNGGHLRDVDDFGIGVLFVISQ